MHVAVVVVAIFTDYVSIRGNAIASICLSIHPSLSTLSFETTDLCLDLLDVCHVWVTAMARRRLKLKVTGQGQDADSLTSIEDSLFSSCS